MLQGVHFATSVRNTVARRKPRNIFLRFWLAAILENYNTREFPQRSVMVLYIDRGRCWGFVCPQILGQTFFRKKLKFGRRPFGEKNYLKFISKIENLVRESQNEFGENRNISVNRSK